MAPPLVMLVDDDEVDLLMTSIALSERGFEVTEVERWRQALRLLVDGARVICSTP